MIYYNLCDVTMTYYGKFPDLADVLPPRRTWDHAIELKEGNGFFTSKVYPLSHREQDELDKFIDEHLHSGRICPSKSPMASPFFFVKKKDGSLRPVQDYRRLSEISIHYPSYPKSLINFEEHNTSQSLMSVGASTTSA
jgi:hypothetical protein